MRIFLDDQRPAPEGWTLVCTAREVIALLEAGGVTHISLDHDLGDAAVTGTGYDVLVWIEEAVATRGFAPPEIAIHSANAGAVPRMRLAVEAIKRSSARSSEANDATERGEKEWDIQGLREALEKVPAEDRSRVAAEIARVFEDFDPANPPGEPVVPLAPGTRVCPNCGGELVELTVIGGEDPSIPRSLILDCETCDAGFSELVDAPVQ